MKTRFLSVLTLLAVLFFCTSCGKQPDKTEESAGSSQPASSVSDNGSDPASSEPLALDEYLSEERYLPEKLYTPRPHEADFRYEAFSDGLYRIPKGESNGECWLEGDWSIIAYNENVVYLMSNEYALYRVPTETVEPERIADLSEYLSGWEDKEIGEQGKFRFFSLYGEELFLFRGADGILRGCYIPTQEVYEIGRNPDTESVYPLTNRSFLYQLPTGELAEDGFSDAMETYLYTGGKYYRVLSGTESLLTQSPLDPDAIAAFLPIDENGAPVLGENFTEASPEEAGVDFTE